MEVTDILALARAGFTADQIMQLAGTQHDPQPQESQPQEPQPSQEPSQEPAPAADKTMTALQESIADLKRLIITSNIAGSKQPAAQSVDDILAQVINPPRKGEENK